MAGATLSAVPMIIIFLYFQKYFIKGITVGGVKGWMDVRKSTMQNQCIWITKMDLWAIDILKSIITDHFLCLDKEKLDTRQYSDTGEMTLVGIESLLAFKRLL